MFRKMPWDSWRSVTVALDDYAIVGPIHPVIQPGAKDCGGFGTLQTAITSDKPKLVFRLEDARGFTFLKEWQVVLHLSQTNIKGNVSPDTEYDLTGKMLLGRGSVSLDLRDLGASIVSFYVYNRGSATNVACNLRVELFGTFSENENTLPDDTRLPFAVNPNTPEFAETPGAWE